MAADESGSGALAELHEAVAAVRAVAGPVAPWCGIVLGTGLGGLADAMDVDHTIPYERIPGLPRPTVESHAGRLLIGRLEGAPVVALQGRLHLYEGWSARRIAFAVRLLRLLGADTLLLSGACGGMNPLWGAGDVVLLDDHINLLGDNPLIGPNLDALGPRFPDMSAPYDPELQALAVDVALELGVGLRRGVYAAVSGPSLETRAEYRMLRTLGADVVGMSTVPEVIAARHAGMRVLALSIVTDQCLPDALEEARIEDILAVAARAEPSLTSVVRGVLSRLAAERSSSTP
jgi:purine-nucleoside phosphorylase